MSTRRGGRYIPLAYGAIALLAVLAVFPSAMRPPPDETSASASFSPDAPPDEDPDVIIQSLQQARSQTAGGVATEEEEVVEAGAVATTTTTLPPPVKVLTRGQCFGNPPRQVESPYAGPCVAAWQGDNGGDLATPGVDADEIRVIIWNTRHGVGYAGRIPSEPHPDENATGRTIRIYQQYLNQNYEFYGRRLQLIADLEPSGAGLDDGGDPAEQRAHVIATEEKYGGLFGAFSDTENMLVAAAQRGMIGIGGFGLSHDVYANNAPYLYGWEGDGTHLASLNAEYLCKRLADNPAQYAGDPLMHTQTRKFGLVYQETQGKTGFENLPTLVKDRCGLDMLAYAVTADPESSAIPIAAFRAEGTTSIVVATLQFAPAFVTQTAEGQGYRPEWIVAGMGLVDDNGTPGYLYHRGQWANAFGITAREMDRPWNESYEVRAYKSIDPGAMPDYNNSRWVYPILMTFANGIQGAGPNLTAESFSNALFAMPPRNHEDRTWRCCGFSPDSLAYSNQIMEIYYDGVATTPSHNGPGGTYIYPDCGVRRGEGQLPEGEPVYFQGGCRTPDDKGTHPPTVR